MRAGLAFTLIGTFAGLLHSVPATHAVVIHAPVALLSAMPPKRKNVSNLGKRAEKFSCLPPPQEDVAAAEATTEAHATMSDYDAAAADDEAGGDSDGTHSSEDEDEDEDGDDNEDEPDGGDGSKITSWFQRVYEAGLTF